MVNKNLLRQYRLGSQKPWTKEELSVGFNYFKKLYGYYPSAHEIDDFPYLPSSRSIQRSHGGLVGLRKELLISKQLHNHTTGVIRSNLAKQINKNSRQYELDFYKKLIIHFKEISIHEHKVIRPGGVSCDFYIYLSENSGVVIDIFYAANIRNLLKIINIKLKRYSLISEETYLVVVGNSDIKINELFIRIKNKKSSLPSHISCITEDYFKESIIPKLRMRSEFCN